MFEKVNPCHPDKIADRIAGAIVDLAYKKEMNPKIAVEVLIGHGYCHIITESNLEFRYKDIVEIVDRIAGKMIVDLNQHYQDEKLSKNQKDEIRCGDNGIFKGTLVTEEQKLLSEIAHGIYDLYKSDGKYILHKDQLIICQSNVENPDELRQQICEAYIPDYEGITINPLGFWTGGTNVDTGATNRKLGSDMGDSVTGGGLHGKDLSKADVSINIYAWLKSQEYETPVDYYCAIGDEYIDGKPYSEIVEIARDYINGIGGFEKFAEWGFI